MPKVSDTYLETRRQQVLDAAYSCFARNGFHETTMQDIAREAGVSYGVVYHYFDSKEDVIEEVWQASREAREIRLRKAYEKTTVPDVLAEFLGLSVSRLERPESIPEMRLRIQLFGEALLNPRIAENLRGVWDYVLELLEDLIRQGQGRGEINPVIDTKALARAYIAVHDGLVLQKAIDPEVDIGKIIDVFRAMHQGALWHVIEGEDGGHGNAKGQEIYSESEGGDSQ
jgi:AcrR family transcriptional regulator